MKAKDYFSPSSKSTGKKDPPAKKKADAPNTLYVSDKNDPAYAAYSDSLQKYQSGAKPQLTGKKSFGEYGSHSIKGKSVKDVPLPEGYKVPGTNQPVGQRVTKGYYPQYVGIKPPYAPGGKEYKKVTKDVYKKPTRPVVVDKEAASKTAPKPAAKQTAQKTTPKAPEKSTKKITLSKDASIAKQQIQLYGPGGKYSGKKP
jgi:hypothetical protein